MSISYNTVPESAAVCNLLIRFPSMELEGWVNGTRGCAEMGLNYKIMENSGIMKLPHKQSNHNWDDSVINDYIN